MDDPFIKQYIDDILRNIRNQYILKLITPYDSISLDFISQVSFSSTYSEKAKDVATENQRTRSRRSYCGVDP